VLGGSTLTCTHGFWLLRRPATVAKKNKPQSMLECLRYRTHNRTCGLVILKTWNHKLVAPCIPPSLTRLSSMRTKMYSYDTVRPTTTRSLRGKRSTAARSITDQNGVLLGNEEDIIGRWKDFLMISRLQSFWQYHTHSLLRRKLLSMRLRSPWLSIHWQLERLYSVKFTALNK